VSNGDTANNKRSKQEQTGARGANRSKQEQTGANRSKQEQTTREQTGLRAKIKMYP
jgi:hypothetical protein